jgi:hypothetical protein
MAFRMVRMVRVASGAFKARKGIPKDVREQYKAHYGVGREAIFHASAEYTLQRAKVLLGEWKLN